MEPQATLPPDVSLPGGLFIPAQGRLVAGLRAHSPAVHLAAQELGLGVPQLRRLCKGQRLIAPGVFTRRGFPSSSKPDAPSVTKPTQSISLTFAEAFSSLTSHALAGTNLGSVVIMLLPEADCGSSSVMTLFKFASVTLGMTSSVINFLISVDFPVLTGPTTAYIDISAAPSGNVLVNVVIKHIRLRKNYVYNTLLRSFSF